ncbi:hypothetical protein H112_03203 [Trichophyton rubrum D6]|uniref:Uncharacterized protein n=2 Tax=Trichophyton TaxID=5550 RepID=A0A022W6L5_TRIRU|nr:hypothetical protein H100_03207 [Trichophyton rubrum MR850]EZF43302.1 hypothetical protein H102_03201 [Trichophyton rubrum CBS 100081]EZF53944.1 hypothetical protein H103_03215 [Trichophyton rubrum CBS 288.86]EZF64592.1 hypothetical protein H104_03197 [Trichophyton rubrum CBS 289.86]EZF75174.1 hypothetical protein H105_03219 [Trichophyton soudanense CBS 452.61]EZF85871.1 hypothetical protein H110_03208 [Trichophyton rubrum MR1448]EZF96652.1 hypothetical protein H113_03216 [Trichophyton rub
MLIPEDQTLHPLLQHSRRFLRYVNRPTVSGGIFWHRIKHSGEGIEKVLFSVLHCPPRKLEVTGQEKRKSVRVSILSDKR